MHPEFTQSTKWRLLAQKRIKKQFDFSVSNKGVHLEHSPEYHLYGLEQRYKTLLFLNEWEVGGSLTKELEVSVRKMVDFLPNIIKPNGEIVQVGDSRKVHISSYKTLLNKLENLPPTVYNLINNTRTIIPKSPSTISYNNEGYVILRDYADERSSFNSSFYLFFTAAANEGRGHPQSDHLSFTLSNLGYEIFIDPGYYSYRNDDGREFVTSAYAHNSIIVNGLNYKGWNSSIEEVETGKHFTLIKASHNNYIDFQHRRWLLKLKEDIIIIDIVRDLSTKEENVKNNKYQQLFNISPELKVKLIKDLYSDIFVVSDHSGREILSIEELNKINTKYRIAEGDKNPMIGWHSLEHGKLIPSPSLVSEKKGNNALYVTHIKVPSKNRKNINDGLLKANFKMKNTTEFSIFIHSPLQDMLLEGNTSLGTLSLIQ
jgi:hypothetical protein